MAQMSQVNLCISLILSPEKETTTTWNFHSSSSVEIGHRPQGETLASALSGPRYPAGVRRTRLRHFLEKQEQDGGHRLTPVQEKAVMCSDSSTREGRTNELSVQLLGCQTALHTCPSPPPRPLQALPLGPVGCFPLLSLCSQPLRIMVELIASLSCLSISSLALGARS